MCSAQPDESVLTAQVSKIELPNMFPKLIP